MLDYLVIYKLFFTTTVERWCIKHEGYIIIETCAAGRSLKGKGFYGTLFAEHFTKYDTFASPFGLNGKI